MGNKLCFARQLFHIFRLICYNMDSAGRCGNFWFHVYRSTRNHGYGVVGFMNVARGRRKMFEQDYIMRVIKEMIRAILKLLFSIDTDSPTMELLSEKEQVETTEKLLEMVDGGKINEAENRLYDFISDSDMGSLEIALLFYSYLNDKTDAFLEENAFSREEVKSGMKNLVDMFGLSSIAGMFLEDL